MKITEQKRKSMIMFGLAAVMIVVISVVFFVANSNDQKLSALVDLGQKYLEENDYENAILVFDQAIAIEPKCEEAYLGKAQAQYAMGQYEDAVATLELGIVNVDNTSRLEEFLQRILTEIEKNEIVEKESVTPKERTVPLQLNYSNIVRYVNTENPTIQLEILGEEGAKENYIWESSNPECAVVSETGLITCLPKRGFSDIRVATTDGTEWDNCTVWVVDSETMITETLFSNELLVMVDGEGEDQEQFFVLPVPVEEQEYIVIDNFPQYIYFSDDIVIPDRLQYGEGEWPVRGITYRTFRFCNKLKSVHIPSAVEIEEEGGDSPFIFCTELQEIDVDSGNEYLKSIDGVLYSGDGTALISYPAAKEGSTYILPKEVETVYHGAFLGCGNLEEILVEEGNEYYESIDGSLIRKDEQKLVAYPIGRKVTSYTVPDSVKRIESDAFYASKLEEVSCISVEEIWDVQFTNCDKLKRIYGGSGTMRIYMNDFVVEIMGMDQMTNLEELIFGLAENQDFSDIAALKNLERLSIHVNGLSSDLQKLGELSAVETLSLWNMDNIKDLSWILKMDPLKNLSLSTKSKEIDLQVLGGLSGLESLYIEGADKLKDFSWLPEIDGLISLSLELDEEQADLQALGQLTELVTLSISGVDEIRDFSWLSNMKELKEIFLQAENNSNLDEACREIGKLKNIERLNIIGISRLENLSWLEGMDTLNSVGLTIKDKFEVMDLSPMMELSNLSYVTLRIPEEDEENLSDDILEQIEKLGERKVAVNILLSL